MPHFIEASYAVNWFVALVSSVGTGVVSNWLYEKLKGRSPKLYINRTTEVEIVRDKIKIRIVERIEKAG